MDPVIFDVAGPIKLRWYGLGYLLSFVFGYYLLRWQARKKIWVLPESKVGDFIAYAAFFGVFLGGRLGYILFYQIPKDNFNGWDELLADPAMIFRVWDGGMASHGGILGLMIFTLIYARKNKVSWTGVGDGLCVVAPIGLGLVRIANFINGELYGRVAHGVSWAVKFPDALRHNGRAYDAVREAGRLAPEVYEFDSPQNELLGHQLSYLIEKSRDNPEILQALGNHLDARHPSQLYEALLEGLVLFVILFLTRVRFPKLPHGILTGLFFLLYAVFRITVEGYREPDSAMIGALTKGQFYSTFMIVAGVGFIGFALWRQKKAGAL